MFTFEDADLYEKCPNGLGKTNTPMKAMNLGSNPEKKNNHG